MYGQKITTNKNPKLVIFDLHGVLYERQGDDKYVIDKEMLNIVRQLLTEQNRRVAIWTSATYRTMNNLVDDIFREDREKLAFLWSRDRVKLDPELLATTPYATYKDINDLLLHPYLNREGIYTTNNVLMIDDSYQKVKRNPRRTYYIWQGKNRDYRQLYNILFP